MDVQNFWKLFGHFILLLSGFFLVLHENLPHNTEISRVHHNENQTKALPIQHNDTTQICHHNETEMTALPIQHNMTGGCKLGFLAGGVSLIVFSMTFHWIELGWTIIFGDHIPEYLGKWYNFRGPLAATVLARFHSVCTSRSNWLFISNFTAVLGTLVLLVTTYPANTDFGLLGVVCGVFAGIAIRDYIEKEWELWIAVIASLAAELFKSL